MFICKIELEDASKDAAYPVGEIRIGQVAGDCFVADYVVEIDKASRQARSPGVWRSGLVRRFDHSELGPYDLLLRALIACLGGRSHLAVRELAPGASTFKEIEPA